MGSEELRVKSMSSKMNEAGGYVKTGWGGGEKPEQSLGKGDAISHVHSALFAIVITMK